MDKLKKSDSVLRVGEAKSCKMYLDDKEIQGTSDFKIPFQSKETISFYGTYDPSEPTLESLFKDNLPDLPRECDFTLNGLFRNCVFSGLIEFTGVKGNSLSGNTIGELRKRYEYTMLSKGILLTAWIVVWGLFVYLVAF